MVRVARVGWCGWGSPAPRRCLVRCHACYITQAAAGIHISEAADLPAAAATVTTAGATVTTVTIQRRMDGDDGNDSEEDG